MRIRFKREARADLRAIKEHVHSENPRAAMRLLAVLRQRTGRLAEMPRLGRARPELAPDLRSAAVGNYVIFYTVDPDIVWIQRILHGARDIDAILPTTKTTPKPAGSARPRRR